MMTRILSTTRLDVQVQWRSRFYVISIALALLLGFGVRQLVDAQTMTAFMPILFLLGVGGTGMVYVAGLLIFERDQHTLDALFVSPLKLTEYVNAKLLSLALLLLVESTVLVLAAQGFGAVNGLLLVAGVVIMAFMFTLFGLILIVRFSNITDFLIPALVVALPLQMPALYFMGLSDSPLWLLIPSSAPTMLIWGAWNPLEPWQLAYGVGYSAMLIGVAYLWALRAFAYHVIQRKKK